MIIWIASYPRSGSTWIRALVSTYLFSEKENKVFDNIKKIINFPNINHFKGIFEINEFSKEELSILRLNCLLEELKFLQKENQI